MSEANGVKQTDRYRSWANSLDKSSTPTQIYIYMFNIVNPDDVLKGSKPVVEQTGPYVYTVNRQRGLLNHSTSTFGSKTLEYYEWKEYIFNLEASVGPDSTPITNTNLVFHSLRAHPLSAFLLPQFLTPDLNTDSKRMFLTKTVKEWLWGWPEPLVNPQNPSAGYYPGLLGPPNTSLDSAKARGLRAIYTGEDETAEAYSYYMLDGSKSFVSAKDPQNPNKPLWTTVDASLYLGTDGQRFAPFMKKESPLDVYIEEAKRNLQLTYTREVSRKGLTLWEYRISNSVLQSAQDNPLNAQWHMFRPGIFNQTVALGTEIILSKPHFLDADVGMQTGVVGMSPDPEEHDTALQIHPITGVTMHARKQLQVNVNTKGPLLNPILSIPSINNGAPGPYPANWFPDMLSDTYQPIGYVSERGEVSNADAKKLNSSLGKVKHGRRFLQIGSLVIIFVFLGASAVFIWLAFSSILHPKNTDSTNLAKNEDRSGSAEMSPVSM